MSGFYKFLAAGQIAPFARTRWSPRWQEVARVEACVAGLHACRPADLPYWLHDELWRVELVEPVPVGRKVVARRGRLLSRVAGWDAAMAGRLRLAAIGRIAGHAAAECGDADDGSLAEASELLLAGVDSALRTVPELARSRQEAAARRGRTAGAVICGYLGDAADMADSYPVAMLAYLAERAAGERTPTGADAGLAPGQRTATGADAGLAERAWQSEWLVKHLDLEG